MLSKNQDYEILEFEPVEETWNEYELADGNRIKGRVVLIRLFQIFDKLQSESPTYEAEKTKFFVTYAPTSNRGTPNLPSTQEEFDKIKKIPVKVLSNNEKWTYTVY